MIMIIGPSGTGKTKIAYELARKNNGAVINLDRAYLYKRFPIATGLQDTLMEQNVPRYLYELLEPDEPSYSADVFAKMVDRVSSEVLASGKLPIVEGGSTIYVPALLALNAEKNLFDHVIGLKFPAEFEIAGRYRQRIDQAFKDGLVEELAAHLTEYRDSYLIKECHAAVPTVRYLDGELSLDDAKSEILKRALNYKDRQMNLFLGFPNIHWMDVSNFSDCYQKVQRADNR